MDVTMTEQPPAEIKRQQTEEEIARVQAEVQVLKRHLLAPADTKFPLQPTEWKLTGRTDILHFRKLSFPQVLEHQDELIEVPPRFTTKTWAKDEWETLPEEMRKWWREPRKPTKDEALLMRKASSEILALASADGKTAEEFSTFDASVLTECFQFVATISGFSDDALELLDWFRQQQ
jgi:hypothetical protein